MAKGDRERRYTKRLMVAVTPQTAAHIEELADACGVSMATVIRATLAGGLPSVTQTIKRQMEQHTYKTEPSNA